MTTIYADAPPLFVNGELTRESSWFRVLRAVAYRHWDGDRYHVVNGYPYRLVMRTDKAVDGPSDIPLGPADNGLRRVLEPAAQQDPIWVGLSRLEHLDDGTYVLLDPKRQSVFDPVPRPTAVRELGLAYLHAPLEYEGMRQWLGRMSMAGLLWVATGGDGHQRRATVTWGDCFGNRPDGA